MVHVRRIGLIVAISAAFYGLLLGLIAGGGWVFYTGIWGPERHIPVAVFGLVVAIVALWTGFTGWRVPPTDGLPVNAAEQPKLFALFVEVAETMQLPMPSRVFLVGEANASVSHVGGWMGIGGRAEFCIGLPLVATLSRRELQSVFAHELGHFRRGDQRLGLWILRARDGLLRIVKNLRFTTFLNWPLRAYAGLFLRLTQSYSRQQELAADADAATLVGKDAYTRALQAGERVDALFTLFLEAHYFAMLAAGLRPPLAAGLVTFLESPLAKELGREWESVAQDDPGTPYDSHPPLAQRIEWLSEVTQPARLEEGTDGPALELVQNLARCEERLVEIAFGVRLKAVDWESGARTMLTRMWNVIAFDECLKLRDATVADFGQLLGSSDLAERLRIDPKVVGGDGESADVAKHMLGVLLAHQLVRSGFEIDAQPGYDIVLHKGKARVLPFRVGSKDPEDTSGDPDGMFEDQAWRAWCNEHGLGDIALGGQEARPLARELV